jgi:hypothetical protein
MRVNTVTERILYFHRQTYKKAKPMKVRGDGLDGAGTRQGYYHNIGCYYLPLEDIRITLLILRGMWILQLKST